MHQPGRRVTPSSREVARDAAGTPPGTQPTTSRAPPPGPAGARQKVGGESKPNPFWIDIKARGADLPRRKMELNGRN